MRLTCLTCGARYEVPVDAVPAGGRDVQCSVCGHTWLARPEDAEGAAAQAGPAADRPTPRPGGRGADDGAEPRASGGAPAQRSSLTREVEGILREEAAREAAARAVLRDAPPEAVPVPREDQRAEEARRRMARLRDEPTPRPDPQPDLQPDPPGPAPRRDRLPDIEAVSSGLRPSDDPAPPPPERARGFRLGLVLALILAAVLALVYAYKPAIVGAWPASAAVLQPYEDAVNDGRWWLDGRLRALLDAVGGPGGPGADAAGSAATGSAPAS